MHDVILKHLIVQKWSLHCTSLLVIWVACFVGPRYIRIFHVPIAKFLRALSFSYLIKALSLTIWHRGNLLVHCVLFYIHLFVILGILVLIAAKIQWEWLIFLLLVILNNDDLLWGRRFYRIVIWLRLQVHLLGWNIYIFYFLGYLEVIVKVIIDGSSIVLIQQIYHAFCAPSLHFSLIFPRIFIQ